MRDLWALVRQYLEHFPAIRKRNKLKQYILVLLLVVVFFGLEVILFIISGIGPRFTLSLLLIIVIAWFGGFGLGIFATVLLGGLSYYFLFEPRGSFLVAENFASVIYLFLFFIEGVFISILIESHRRSDVERNEFISIISHEIKNPLTSIKGYAELIKRLAEKNREKKFSDYATRIDKQIKHIMLMINEMLDLTKIEVGQFTYHDETFLISDLVKEVISDQQVITKTHNIFLFSSVNSEVKGDRYRIGQVITNLIHNAIKYSPKSKKVTVNVISKNKGVLISIKDFGVGIPQSYYNKVFLPFTRIENIIGTRGTGLGLYISLQIVTRHKGKLWFESREGKGSIFYLWLPATKK